MRHSQSGGRERGKEEEEKKNSELRKVPIKWRGEKINEPEKSDLGGRTKSFRCYNITKDYLEVLWLWVFGSKFRLKPQSAMYAREHQRVFWWNECLDKKLFADFSMNYSLKKKLTDYFVNRWDRQIMNYIFLNVMQFNPHREVSIIGLLHPS